MTDQNNRLNPEKIEAAARQLAESEPAFSIILKKFGPPPLWDRQPDFPTLIYIILEQQVSLSSAKAAFLKLNDSLGTVTPQAFLKLNDDELKAIGFSHQKTRYGRIVANAVLDGKLDFNKLDLLPDEQVKKTLMSITGIGHWTSDIYLLMCLLRPDVWPHGDRALAVAAMEVFGLNEVPDYDTLRTMAQKWKPWRSVAARLLWHHYLRTPRKRIR